MILVYGQGGGRGEEGCKCIKRAISGEGIAIDKKI
jgi:hypothetical protein